VVDDESVESMEWMEEVPLKGLVAKKKYTKRLFFVCMFSMAAVAQSSSGGVEIRHVAPLLWAMACFNTLTRNRRLEQDVYMG